jgi:hypothetical protein
MSETIDEFKTGPYEILNYKMKTDEGKIVIELNENDLGRLPIENMETVEELREALDQAEEFFIEQKRRGEEL